MKEYLLVGAGGALGSLARYLCGAYFLHTYPNAKFPWGTLFVNLLGCFLIGVCAGFIEKLSVYNSELRLLLITGILGGFTTFSAFGLESIYLFKNAQTMPAFLYIGSSVIVGCLLTYLGLKIFA